MTHLVMVDLSNFIMDDVKLLTHVFRTEFKSLLAHAPIRSDPTLHSHCKQHHPNWILEEKHHPPQTPFWVFSIQSQIYHESLAIARQIWKVQFRVRQSASNQVYPSIPNLFRLKAIGEWRRAEQHHYRIMHYERNPRITVTQLLR